MEKIRSIAAHINELTEEERRLLIKELHPNEYFKKYLEFFLITGKNRSIKLEFNKTKFTIIYLSDYNYRCLLKYFRTIGIPIKNLFFQKESQIVLGRIFLTDFFNENDENNKPLSIGECYWILNYLFGEEDNRSISGKGTFLFPFYLEVNKGDKTYPYAFSVFDWRGLVEFQFYRCLEGIIVDNHDYYSADETEFSEEEIDYFIVYFVGYLTGSLEAVKSHITPFYKIVESNSLIFGYSNKDNFFEYEYGDEEDKKRFLQKSGFTATSVSVGK
jgi:hypothetical protein